MNQDVLHFNDIILNCIFRLAREAADTPPNELFFGQPFFPGLIANTMVFVGFFSQTLTTVCYTSEDAVMLPYPFFLICPRLREVDLDGVQAAVSYDNYPDKLCSGISRVPLLAYLLEQMVSPTRFQTQAVLWSNLRYLMSPQEEGEMACLQPILDESVMLEELHLTHLKAGFKLL
jgi:hypothetical protein